MVKASSGDRSPLLLKALAVVAEAARAFTKLNPSTPGKHDIR